MDVITYARRALLRTLADELPGRLTTLDSSRLARVVCPPGPYTIPASGTLTLNGVSVTGLTSGSRTAAQVATEINAANGITVTAAADADGRLQITSQSAPSADVASEVRIGTGTANDALSLTSDDGDLILSLGSPRLRVLDRAWHLTDGVARPTISFESMTKAPQQPRRVGLENVSIRLLLLYPGQGSQQATLEAVRAIASEIEDVIADGDDRGPHLVGGETYGDNIEKAETSRSATEEAAAQFGKGATFIGAMHLDVLIGVYNP